ncbi:uncharacterized protein A4U43_C01F11850 [Asparagus officinalis]|uniref:START domain-containing protein n=1 Tax=Asparagus officinalis TaxID=4686 RepID=A0A5P1FP75_ASPOF|nr:protein ENHANCED DISEASE RESISTANCE 2-like [Asparagus officinalis]ONK79922.1 uncharacterized protein A4U43_C01F11850 [Asparagus officinalis]
MKSSSTIGKKKEAPKVIHEGWMVRYGRRKIGRSFFHMRYFVLELTLLAYYKKKPKDNMVPLRTLQIDGSCRVEDRGLKPHQGHMVYVLSIYKKKESYDRITMAAFNIQEAMIWKEKIELVIDQHQGLNTSNGNKNLASYKSIGGNQRNVCFDDQESQFSQEDEEEHQQVLLPRRKTINEPPGSVPDWTQELESGLSNQDNSVQASSSRHWRLVRLQNGLRFFEELLEADLLPSSCSKAMKAVGVIEATSEAIFELIISMDCSTRFEWDCCFQYGSLVEEVDGHTAVLYHRLHLDWLPKFAWPRDLCYVRYWRYNDDGSYVILFRSREHTDCGPQPGFVRAHIESGGFKISPLRSRNGRPRTQVQHLMQIDMKGWISFFSPSFQQYSLIRMLNNVAGLRDWFSQTDETHRITRIPVMSNMTSDSLSLEKDQMAEESDMPPTPSLDQIRSSSKHSVMLDEESDEDEDQFQNELEEYPVKPETDIKQTASDQELSDQIDLSCISGNLRWDDGDNGRDCWKTSDGNNFKVRSKNFMSDKSKVPAGKPLMKLVAVDWLKDTKRIDHVGRRHGCAAQVASEKGLSSLIINLQVPGSTFYSLVFYFMIKTLKPGSLLQRFFDGDDEFRSSRFKLIPAVPKGSWIVRQSVGNSACLLAKAVDCTFIREPKYLEIDVDIGSSTVAKGVLGLVLGVVTTLVVDMAFLVQGNTAEELPEQIIGSVRISHLELASAVASGLDINPLDE